jgi:hypothetical protein
VKIFRNSFRVLKFGIAIGAYCFVVLKLANQDFNHLSQSLSSIKVIHFWIPSLVLLLMPISWIFEALKWQISLRNIEIISLSSAFKSVWYGVSVGLLTPNRVGEPLGRLVWVEPRSRGKAGIMAVLCGMSQQLATLLFGGIGLAILLGVNGYLPEELYNPVVLIILVVVAAITIILVIKIDMLSYLLSKNRYLRGILSGESVDFKISLSDKIKLILLSIIRYSIFSTQFVLILIYFGYDSSILQAYSAIFATYLFASAIPSFAIGEAGVRTSFALIFIGGLWGNVGAIALATFMLWILNVALPGLMAAWLPLFRSNGEV